MSLSDSPVKAVGEGKHGHSHPDVSAAVATLDHLHEVVSFDRSWHGMTSGAASATFSAGRRGYGPPMPGNLTISDTELDAGLDILDNALTAVLVD